MLLRLNLALTNFRQLDVRVRDDIDAAALNGLVHTIVSATHGHQDLVVIQCVEEMVSATEEEVAILPLLHAE